MAYTVSIAIPFDDWTSDDELVIKNELKKFGVESHILTPSSSENIDVEKMMLETDMVLVIYDKRSFESDMIEYVIGQAVKCGKRTIVIKEEGVPLRGRVINVDVIEYDPKEPDKAIALLIQYIRNAKSERDGRIGKQIVGWTLGLALAAGVGYLLYKMLKK